MHVKPNISIPSHTPIEKQREAQNKGEKGKPQQQRQKRKESREIRRKTKQNKHRQEASTHTLTRTNKQAFVSQSNCLAAATVSPPARIVVFPCCVAVTIICIISFVAKAKGFDSKTPMGLYWKSKQNKNIDTHEQREIICTVFTDKNMHHTHSTQWFWLLWWMFPMNLKMLVLYPTLSSHLVYLFVMYTQPPTNDGGCACVCSRRLYVCVYVLWCNRQQKEADWQAHK